MSERASTKGRERPILFSAPMVRALLAGTKTQTRRVLQLPTKTAGGFPIYERPDMGGWEPTTVGGAGCTYRDGSPSPEMVAIWHQTTGICMSTPIQSGDRLWVREAWRTYSTLDDAPAREIGGMRLWYCADDGYQPKSRVRSPIHMPRIASRLTLTVTDVRVHRINDIKGRDIIAEGLRCDGCFDTGHSACRDGGCFAQRIAFENLWDSINGLGCMASNPWVAAYTFTVERRNIDEGLGQRADATPNPLSEGRERS